MKSKLFIFFFEMVLYLAQAGLEVSILLPQPLKYRDYRYVPPYHPSYSEITNRLWKPRGNVLNFLKK